MGRNHGDWDELGKTIQDIVDHAVRSQDYQKLNQTVRQAVDRAVDFGSEAIRKATASTAAPKEQKSREPARPVVVERKNLPVLYGSGNRQTVFGILKVVGGSMLSFFTLLALLSVGFVNLIAGTGFFSASVGIATGGCAAGACLIAGGIRQLGRIGRFKAYRKELGEKTHVTLEKLSRAVGKSTRYVRREVERMIGEGLFLEGHLDREETTLITSDETYRHFEENRRLLEQRQKQEAEEKAREAAAQRQQAEKTPSLDPQVRQVLDQGNAFIAEIRRCNDAIPGEEISEKISRMETIVRRIFLRAEEHPEIVPDLRKLMDYYLPMTVKLLNAYAEMDAQPVAGETIQSSKREIEQTLDTLNAAFEKLLDSVFKNTALDVSSDISVLQTLLAQEGLTEDELMKMKKSTGRGE